MRGSVWSRGGGGRSGGEDAWRKKGRRKTKGMERVKGKIKEERRIGSWEAGMLEKKEGRTGKWGKRTEGLRGNKAREKTGGEGGQWGEVNKGKVELGKKKMVKMKEEKREWGEKCGKEKGKYRKETQTVEEWGEMRKKGRGKINNRSEQNRNGEDENLGTRRGKGRGWKEMRRRKAGKRDKYLKERRRKNRRKERKTEKDNREEGKSEIGRKEN
jgi:hypothetical protein